jgi:branched-chain amino acid transport system substrate-binding protein
MQAAGSTTPTDYAGEIMDIANAPGEPVLPGQLGMALEMIAAGEDVNYEGATGVELVEPGEAAGSYAEFVVEDGALSIVGYR